MTTQSDVNASLAASTQAYHLFGLALQVFQAEAGRFDYEACEREREKLHAHLDDYVDHFMAANRRIQVGS